MARTSPITIGLGVLMVGVVAAGVVLLTRPRHIEPPATVEVIPDPTPEPAPPPRPPAPEPPARRALPPPPRPLPAPPPVAVAEPPSIAPSADAGPPVPQPGAGRALLVRSHNLRLAEADEQAFTSLNLDEATRARIREINQQHKEQSEVDANTSEARATARARLEAIRLLLGNDGAQKFDTAERSAIRALRGKYRYQWGQMARTGAAAAPAEPEN